MHKIDWTSANVAITGGVGTVGRAIIQRLVSLRTREIRAIDIQEQGLQDLAMMDGNVSRLRPFWLDVRDRDQLVQALRGVDYVIHAAAMKHVEICEHSPESAVQVNIYGVQNVIAAAHEANVKKVIFISTDKAINPTNVMGASKLLGEKLVSAANFHGNHSTVYACARFGNVAGSSGSVIPIFLEQLRHGRTLSLTDRQMTRFFMTIEEAVNFVLRSLEVSQGGETYIPRMPVIRIEDLAMVMRDELSSCFGHRPEKTEIKVIGARTGEKIYEELMNTEEVRRTYANEELVVVVPAFISPEPWVRAGYRRESLVLRSDKIAPMDYSQIRSFLRRVAPLQPYLRAGATGEGKQGHDAEGIASLSPVEKELGCNLF